MKRSYKTLKHRSNKIDSAVYAERDSRFSISKKLKNEKKYQIKIKTIWL